MTFQDDPPAPLLDQGGIPDKLQSVAQALFAMQQDAAPLQRATVPTRLGEGPGRDVLAAPAPLPLRPAPRVISLPEPDGGTPVMGLGVIGPPADGLAETDERFVPSSQVG